MCQIDAAVGQGPVTAVAQLHILIAQDRGDLDRCPGILAQRDVIAHTHADLDTVAGQLDAGDVSDRYPRIGHVGARLQRCCLQELPV